MSASASMGAATPTPSNRLSTVVGHVFVKVAGDLAHDGRRALRLQGAGRAGAPAGPVVEGVPLIDVAGAGQLRTPGANVDIALPVEDEVGPAESAIVAGRLVPH